MTRLTKKKKAKSTFYDTFSFFRGFFRLSPPFLCLFLFLFFFSTHTHNRNRNHKQISNNDKQINYIRLKNRNSIKTINMQHQQQQQHKQQMPQQQQQQRHRRNRREIGAKKIWLPLIIFLSLLVSIFQPMQIIKIN